MQNPSAIFRLAFMLAILCWLPLFAQAQPAEGARLTTAIALGSGRSVPLPEGKWQVALVKSIREGPDAIYRTRDYRTEVYVLMNLDPGNALRAIVVTNAVSATRFSNARFDTDASMFLKDWHGTQPSQSAALLSGFYEIDASFPRTELAQREHLARALRSGMDFDAIARSAPHGLLLADIRQFSIREGVQLLVFIRPPGATRAADVKARMVSDPAGSPAAQYLTRWISSYAPKAAKAFLDKDPQEMAAFQFPGEPAAGPAVVTAAASVSTGAMATGVSAISNDIAALERERRQLEASIREQDLARERAAAAQEQARQEAARLAREAAAAREELERQRAAQEALKQEQARQDTWRTVV